MASDFRRTFRPGPLELTDLKFHEQDGAPPPALGWSTSRQRRARRRCTANKSGARQLFDRARAAGAQAYADAVYDLAMACILLARVLPTPGGSEQALPLPEEARRGFVAIARERGNKAAERMASVCLAI